MKCTAFKYNCYIEIVTTDRLIKFLYDIFPYTNNISISKNLPLEVLYRGHLFLRDGGTTSGPLVGKKIDRWVGLLGDWAGKVKVVSHFLLKRLQHEQLLEDLGLTGLPDLSCQEHLIHHGVHLQGKTQTLELWFSDFGTI